MSVPPSPYMQQQMAQPQPEMSTLQHSTVPVWDAGFRTYDSGIQSGVLSGTPSVVWLYYLLLSIPFTNVLL